MPSSPSSAQRDVVEWSAGWLRRHFRPEAARGLAAVIVLELSGPGGGRLCLQIEDGALKVSPGGDVAPAARLTLAAADWRDVLEGRANAEMLAVGGRIQAEGDLGLALKLRSLFRRRP